MTEQTDLQQQLLQQLQALTQQPAPAGSGWQQQPAGQAAPVAVSVPVKLGNIRIYLQFGGEHAANPQALENLLSTLERQGVPLDRWQPRNQWGGNRGGYGGRGGGW